MFAETNSRRQIWSIFVHKLYISALKHVMKLILSDYVLLNAIPDISVSRFSDFVKCSRNTNHHGLKIQDDRCPIRKM